MKRLLLILLFAFFTDHADAATYWGGEVPTVADTKIQTSVLFNGDYFIYTYTIISGPNNTGNIKALEINLLRNKGTLVPDGAGLPKKHVLDMGSNSSDPTSVPSGLMVSSGSASSGFNYEGWGRWGRFLVAPNSSLTGFIINSRGLPGIREVKVIPKLESPNEEDVGAFELAGNDYWKFIASVNFYTKAVAPTAPPGLPDGQPNLSLMMEQLSGYLDESVALGWLKDPALHDALKAKAGSAIAAAGDTNTARAALDEFIALVSQSAPAQRTDEAYALFYFNAKYILDHLMRSH